MKKIIKKIFIIGCVLLLSAGLVSAAGEDEFDTVSTGFTIGDNSRNTIFSNVDNYTPTTSETNKFPFTNKEEVYNEQGQGSKTVTYSVSQISFDRKYGFNKKLVDFKGEIPRALAVTNENGVESPNPEFKDLRYNDYDTINNWSSEVAGLGADTSYKKLQEYANKENDVRLMSHLKQYASGFGDIYSQINISGAIVSLALQLVAAIFAVQRFSVAAILTQVDAPALGNTINNLFIGTSGNASPFLIFCILSFIFAIVGAAWKYVKGNGAADKPREVIILGFIGLAIIGAALTNRAYLFASPVSNIANKLLETVKSTANPNTDIFLTKLSSSNVPQIDSLRNSYNHESLIRKAYIDMTIESQFGVTMEDLQIGGNYISSGCRLTGASDPSLYSNNLGYYFWFANSGVGTMTKTGITPSRNQSQQFENILDCLQISLNNASSLPAKTRIRTMVKSFAGASGSIMTFSKLLFAIQCVCLAVLLWQFTIPIVMSRLELLISTFGLAVAGPLFITTNKKAIGIAKSILAMFIFAFIKITIYELIVTLIIYIVTFIMNGSDLMAMILTLVLTIMGIRYAPKLAHFLKYKINDMESKFSPELARARSSIKSFGSRNLDSFSRSRFAGTVDKDGNVKLNLLGRLSARGAAELDRDGYRNKVTKDKTRLDAIRRDFVDAATPVSTDYENLANKIAELTNRKEKDITKFIQENMGSDLVENYDLHADEKNDFKDLDINKLQNLKDGIAVKARYANFTEAIKARNLLQNDLDSKLAEYRETKREYDSMSRAEKASSKGQRIAKILQRQADDINLVKAQLATATEDANDKKLKLADSIYKHAYQKVDEAYKPEENKLLEEKQMIEDDIAKGNYKGYNKNIKTNDLIQNKSKVDTNLKKLDSVKDSYRQKQDNVSLASKLEESSNKVDSPTKEIIESPNKEVIQKQGEDVQSSDENVYEEAVSNFESKSEKQEKSPSKPQTTKDTSGNTDKVKSGEKVSPVVEDNNIYEDATTTQEQPRKPEEVVIPKEQKTVTPTETPVQKPNTGNNVDNQKVADKIPEQPKKESSQETPKKNETNEQPSREQIMAQLKEEQKQDSSSKKNKPKRKVAKFDPEAPTDYYSRSFETPEERYLYEAERDKALIDRIMSGDIDTDESNIIDDIDDDYFD